MMFLDDSSVPSCVLFLYNRTTYVLASIANMFEDMIGGIFLRLISIISALPWLVVPFFRVSDRSFHYSLVVLFVYYVVLFWHVGGASDVWSTKILL